MPNITIDLTAITDKARSTDIPIELLIKAGVESYSLCPSRIKTYLSDCMKKIHTEIAYSDIDKNLSTLAVSALLDEGTLVTELVHVHKLITQELINNVSWFVNEASFLRYPDMGKAEFYVDCN